MSRKLWIISALGLLAAIALVSCGCMKVEKGAVHIEITADVRLDEVRGITLANAQQEGKRE